MNTAEKLPENLAEIAREGAEAPCPCGSGAKFKSCHGALKSPIEPQTPVLHIEEPKLKLDLGAGQNVRDGFEGVDIMPGSKHVVDLFKFPWPFTDNSVDEIHCSHFMEHVPMREIEDRDIYTTPGALQPLRDSEFRARKERFVGQDMLFAFFDECWRIMKNGATMKIIVPSLKSERAFQDPTHRRFISQATFLYFAKDWRSQNKLDHYRIKCDFGIMQDVCQIPDHVAAMPEEHQQRRVTECWNTTIDIHATLVCKK